MLSKILSATHYGLEGMRIVVEVEVVKRSFPTFKIVGLPHKSIAEAKERVRSALQNSGFRMPGARVIINLSPADMPKKGAAFDVPIALGIVASQGHVPIAALTQSIFVGELSLDGAILPIRGALPIALHAQQIGIKKMYVPRENACEAGFAKELTIVAVGSLTELIAYLSGKATPSRQKAIGLPDQDDTVDPFGQIYGQDEAKRALEIAVAGNHSVLLKGPPGTGKTLLSQACARLLPRPTEKDVIDIIKIASIEGTIEKPIVRPFRSPHHSISVAGLIGNEHSMRCGEITKAHAGVLFLDEFPEFSKQAIEALREPLDSGKITLSGKRGSLTYPAKPLLILAANPCPCGYLGHQTRRCSCAQQNILAYQRKMSGALIDRIDIHVFVTDVDAKHLTSDLQPDISIHRRVEQARLRQVRRGALNGDLTTSEISQVCTIHPDAQKILTRAYSTLSLSSRSYFKAIKIAQTIADLQGSDIIQPQHMSESLQYRPM